MEEFNNLEEINSFIKSGEMRLLYLTEQGCSVCRLLQPQVVTLLEKYSHVKSAYIDVGKIKGSAKKFGLMTIPVVVIYFEGQEVLREVRTVSLSNLENKIKEYDY